MTYNWEALSYKCWPIARVATHIASTDILWEI